MGEKVQVITVAEPAQAARRAGLPSESLAADEHLRHLGAVAVQAHGSAWRRSGRAAACWPPRAKIDAGRCCQTHDPHSCRWRALLHLAEGGRTTAMQYGNWPWRRLRTWWTCRRCTRAWPGWWRPEQPRARRDCPILTQISSASEEDRP